MRDLLKWFLDSEPDQYAPPPWRVVLAYLRGTATAAQRAAARAKRTGGGAVAGAFDLGAMLRPFVELFQSASSPLSRRHFAPVILRSVGGGDVARGSFPPPRSDPDAFTASATPESFIPESGAPASATPQSMAPASPTPERAAIRSFMERVEWTGGDFRVIQGESGPAAQRPQGTQPNAAPATRDSSTHMQVFLHRPGEVLPHEALFDLPVEAREPRIWLLLIPSLQLFSAAVSASPVRIMWPVAREERACLAMSFAVAGGYRAVAPRSEVEE